jgi:hypothetical protein
MDEALRCLREVVLTKESTLHGSMSMSVKTFTPKIPQFPEYEAVFGV